MKSRIWENLGVATLVGGSALYLYELIAGESKPLQWVICGLYLLAGVCYLVNYFTTPKEQRRQKKSRENA